MTLRRFRDCLLVGLVIVVACNTIVEPPSKFFPVIPPGEEVDIPDSIKRKFMEDAHHLALRHLKSINRDSSEVRISPDLVATLYNCLIRIYEERTIPARDTVMSIFRIHSFHSPEMHRLIVAGDSTKSWMREFRSGKNRTGYPPVDTLMDEFELSMGRYYPSPPIHIVVLAARDPLNLEALGNLFQKIDGVAFAEPDHWVGDGDDIRALSEVDAWKISFSVGTGDCPSGCIFRRIWDFKVEESGTVTFLGSYGSPLPP